MSRADLLEFQEKVRLLALEVAESIEKTQKRERLSIEDLYFKLLIYAIDLLEILKSAGSDKLKEGGKKCLN